MATDKAKGWDDEVLKLEHPDPKKVCCKDCIYREEDRKLGSSTIEGCTLAMCQVFNTKPTGILFGNDECPYHMTEGEMNADSDDIHEGVGVLVFSDGLVLTGTRVKEGTICGPGGHIEEGETPEKAAIRETQEEFGITPTELIPVTDLTGLPEEYCDSHIFLCTQYEGKPICDGHEMSSAEFRGVDKLLDPNGADSSHLYLPFARSLMMLSEALHEDKEDGGPGSGNFSHKGVKGQLGGSAPGGGKSPESSEGKDVHERKAPSVKSPKDFDSYVESKGLKPIYRGYSAGSEGQLKDYAESIKAGTSGVSGEGRSALGKAVYFADQKSEAESYMHRRMQENGHDHGRVSTAALDVGAKVGNQNDYQRAKFQEESDIMEKVWDLPTVEEQRKMADKAMAVRKMDVAEYAASKGCDALYDPATGYTMVMNQNALVIRDDAFDALI